MKKILLSGMLALGTLLSAQELISFEEAEGFFSGSVDGQNGWTTTGTGSGSPNIAGQLISGELFSDGVQSLKVANEAMYGPQTSGPVVGAYKNITNPIDANNFTVSFDVNINQQNADSSDFVFRGLNYTTSTPTYVYYIRFRYNGSIFAADLPAGSTDIQVLDTNQTWNQNTWYRLKIVGTAAGIEYYLNNNLVYTSNHIDTPTVLSRIDFIHDNYGGDAYIDRLAINNEAALSVKETTANDTHITIYPNPTTDVLHISSNDKINGVKLFDMTGRRLNATLSGNTVDVNHLEKGNYIITIFTQKGKTSKKFIKK